MLKILLADDEKWVRATVKSVIPFAELDFVLVGEAANGVEAFDLAVAQAPDILITDIKMPGLNGIELIAKLKETLPDLKTVIISGYDEFALAKKALQLGAVDYLLKPVEAANVTAVLTHVKTMIEAERERRVREKSLQVHYQRSLPLFQEKLLNELIRENSYTPAEINLKLKSLPISLCNQYVAVICIIMDDYISRLKHNIPENLRLDSDKMTARFNKVAKRYLQGLAFANHKTEHEWIMIANPDSRGGVANLSGQVREVLANLQKAFRRRFNITFSAGISSGGHGLQNLSRLYREASQALQYKMLFGKNSLIFFEEIARERENSPATVFQFAPDLIGEIVLNLEMLNENNINVICDHLFAQVNGYRARARETTPELIKAAIWRLVVDVLGALHCAAFPPEKLYEFGNSSLYEEYKVLDTLTGLHQFLKKLFRTLINEYLRTERPTGQNVIDIAKNYLESHFTQDISLELLAGYVFMNPSYFSELFKKETGRNYIEYITCLRMDKAKELLCRSKLKIYEISEAVGYADSKYFCKTFKKWTGLTPSEYKTLNS